MPFRVSGKNIDIGQALRTRVNARIAEVTAKYFDGGFSGHVTIGKEGFGFRTDCVVHLDSGIVLEADALAADAYASADQAALRLEKRLRRYKQRLKDHQTVRADGRAPEDRELDRAALSEPSYAIAASERDGEEEEARWNPVVIAESAATLKRLSVSEAVRELDMQGAPVIVFRHAGHGRVNLIYRRADGHIGWIDLPSLEQDAH
jgi:ribosomal subunit interface protein